MYLRDFGDEPSVGNLHFSTYLKVEKGQEFAERSVKMELNITYLAVGPSQFLAFPSFTE